MNIKIPNHVKCLNPTLVFFKSIIELHNIQRPNVIKSETFRYNGKEQTFYRMDFYPSLSDKRSNITLTKDQYEELNTLLNSSVEDIFIKAEWSEDDLEIYKNSSWFSPINL